MIRHTKTQAGYSLPMVLILVITFTIIFGAVGSMISMNLKLSTGNINSQKALNIAEAGVNYYLWHMSHNPKDFKDGKSTPATPDPDLGYGPYEHQYKDQNDTVIGTFTLWINPLGVNTNQARVRSIGKYKDNNKTRTIEVVVGAPSFSNYAVLADGPLWFGPTETATGPVHSNAGVRMDGANSADVTSKSSVYNPADNTTGYVPPYALGGDVSGTRHDGVWCHSSVTNPNCTTRDKSLWRMSVSGIDFNSITSDLCNMKKIAKNITSDPTNTACTDMSGNRTGSYLPCVDKKVTGGVTSCNYSRTQGYLIQLNPDETYDLYRVTGENDSASSYTAALTRTLVQSNVAFPANGVLFAEDNVWVRSDPTFGGRLTIAAGHMNVTSQTSNNNMASISIADDIVYTTKDTSTSLGLVSQNNVLIPPYAYPQSGAFTFEVNAAVIAEYGGVNAISNYRSGTNQNRCTRGYVASNQKILFIGSVASRGLWTWNTVYDSSCGLATRDNTSGKYFSNIMNTETRFDTNLTYSPPPSFPVTNSYNILSWREVLLAP